MNHATFAQICSPRESETAEPIEVSDAMRLTLKMVSFRILLRLDHSKSKTTINRCSASEPELTEYEADPSEWHTVRRGTVWNDTSRFLSRLEHLNLTQFVESQ